MKGRRREHGFGETAHVISGMIAMVPLAIVACVIFPMVAGLDDRTERIVGVLMLVAFLEASLVAYLPADPIAALVIAAIVLAGGGAGFVAGTAGAMTTESRAIAAGVGSVVSLPIAGVLLLAKNLIAERLKPKPSADA